jgi:hypothetical protein
MTDTPDTGPEHVPGQLDLDVPDRADLERELANVREQAERIAVQMSEFTVRAVDRVAAAAAAYAGAGEQLDKAVAEARGMGATWEQIGRAAGITRQSAWSRWATAGDKL